LAKTKVVEGGKIYNFNIEQKLIGVLDLAEKQELELNFT